MVECWVKRMRKLPRPPRKYLIQAHFAIDVNLEIIIKLGQKVGNRSSIRSEKNFF